MFEELDEIVIHEYSTECVICLEQINESDKVILKCNHIFHKECMNKWIMYNCYRYPCPICKEEYISYILCGRCNHCKNLVTQTDNNEVNNGKQALFTLCIVFSILTMFGIVFSRH